MTVQTIALDVADGVATITLNRPAELNTYTVRMKDELVAAFDAVDSDDSVAAVLVTGSGRAFCAGMDLTQGTARFVRADEPKADRLRDSGGTWPCASSRAPSR